MCVIASLYLEDQSILVKNRDRKYKAFIKVVHEIKNGVEILYIQDIVTDWSEGLNEYGIGITNATLMVNQDEREGTVVKRNKNTISNDGTKIRYALSLPNIVDVVEYLSRYSHTNRLHNGLKGLTIIANPSDKYIIEGTTKHSPVINRIPNQQLIVRTNHGIIHPTAGYTLGPKRKSSVNRLEIAEDNLSKIKKIDEVLNILSKQHVNKNFHNPYSYSSSLSISICKCLYISSYCYTNYRVR